MDTDQHSESQNRPAKRVPIVEEEEDEDEGHRVTSVNSTTTKNSDSKVVCMERVKSKEDDFKAPMLPPTRKIRPAVPKLNGHVTPNDLLAVEQLSIESELGNGGAYSYSELLDPFVNIGKDCYLCPHSRQYIASTYPLLPPRSTTAPRKKGSELNGPPEEFIKEIILDDFSLLLFHSTQDYKLFKEKEDELREKEEAEGRRRLAEERRRLYEENLLLGKVKKKGRKSKKDLEREQKEVRRRERLERREKRRRATYGQRVQRRRERREQRNLEEGTSLSPEERAARRLSRREAREEKQRLRGQRKQEEKQLRRQAKLQLQQQQHHQDPFHTGEQVAVSGESGDCCATQTTTSMARGISTSIPMPGSNSQPPSVGHAAARPQSAASHPNGTSSSTTAVGNQQQSSKGEELKVGVKRSFSTIGIAQTKLNAVLDGGGSGGSGSPAVQHSPMASMNKARKLDSDPTTGMRETLIGIAAAQQSAVKRPPVDTNAYFHSKNAAQLAMEKPSGGILRNPSMPANNNLVADPLLLLSQHMLAQQLMQSMGSHSLTTQPATAPTNTSTSRNLDPNSLLLSASPSDIGALLLNSPQLLTQNPQLLFNYLSEQQQRKVLHCTTLYTTPTLKCNPKINQTQTQQTHIPSAGNFNYSQTHHSTSTLPRTNPMDDAPSSSLSASKPPISDISFPAGAALASQLAGAAILGGKSLASSSSTQGTVNNAQQRAKTHSNAIARKKVCWCNMHVRIAQFIARQQEMRRLGTACHSWKPEGSQPSTSHNGQQTSNFSNASVFQSVQQLQNFIAASGLLPASAMGQPNYVPQVPLASTLHNHQQMALLASAGLLPSTLDPQSQLANLPPQAVRQQQPPSLLGAPLQSQPSSMAGLMTYPASNHPPPFPRVMAPPQQQHQLHQQQQAGKNVPMRSPAASALGFPVMPVSLGASGSLTSGTSNAAASAAAQNSSAANLARLVAGAGTLSSGVGGTGGVTEGGGGVGDVQAAILAQLLLSQLKGAQLAESSNVLSTTPMLPSAAAGPFSSTMSSLDSQAIAAVASLLGGSAASLPANLLPRAQIPSSSYLPPPVPATPVMSNPAPLANLMFPCSTSTATTVPNLHPPGVEKSVNIATQGSSIQQLPLNPLSAQDVARNAQMSIMAAANHLVLPSHHQQQQPLQQLQQSQFKQQLPPHMAPPHQSTTNTNKTVTVKNADSGAASGIQKATGRNTPLNSLLLSPPNSARLASLPPIEQELFMRQHLYTLFMNLGATQAANTTNPPVTLPTIPAVPSVPYSTLQSSPTRPTNLVHAHSTSSATAASVIPPPPEWKELRTTSTGLGTTTTTVSTTMTKESVVTKKEEESGT